MADKGYTSEVVINKILVEMQSILAERYFDEQNPEAYRKILFHPDLNFSAGSRAGYFDLHFLFQVGKVLLGKKDRTIKGNITLDDNALNLSLQMPEEMATPQSQSIKAQNAPINSSYKQPLDSIIHEDSVIRKLQIFQLLQSLRPILYFC